MSMRKRMNKSTVLALGLVIGGMFASTGNIYADTDKKVDANNKVKVELNEMVNTDILNIRKSPSQDSEKIGALENGTVVEVLESKDGWDKIKLSNEKEGWVSSEYTVKEKAKVNVDELNFRKGPSTNDDKLEVLKDGTTMEVLKKVQSNDTEEAWYEVKIVEDKKEEKTVAEEVAKEEPKKEKTGWVAAEYVLTQSQEAKLKEEAAKAEAEAQRQAQVQENKRVEASKNAQKTKSNKVVENRQVAQNVQKTERVAEKSTRNTESNSNGNYNKETVREEKVVSNTNGSTLVVNASAYSGHSITSTGTTPKWGTIAVDPSVIPYGTRVYIPMFDKVFIAEDCGGAIKGNKIDIFMGSESQTDNFGRRNIEIQILG